jgi:transglutaminase-like putative cysteine protease
MKIYNYFYLLLFFVAQGNASEIYQPPISTVRSVTTLEVSADSKYVAVYEDTIRIESQQAISTFAQRSVAYYSDRQTIQVNEAYTLQPDGTRIDVPEASIREKSGNDSYIEFSDLKKKVIVYPDVRVGSKLHYKVTIKEHAPLFPGRFSFSDYFSPYSKIEKSEVLISYPTSIGLVVDSKGMTKAELPAQPGWKSLHFTYIGGDAVPVEESAVSTTDFAPYFAATNFEGWSVYGKTYYSRAEPKSSVTGEIQALADTLTEGLSDQKDQIKAIYYWVAKNIRYISMAFGDGGVVPRDAASILRNRYGDCKDHTVLLEALLKAKRIHSTGALINSGGSYSLPKLAIGTPFNHVITYIPSHDLYLDSTARFAPFGVLPNDMMGKQVILVESGSIQVTPFKSPIEHKWVSDVKIRILPDGFIEGNGRSTSNGWFEVQDRLWRNLFMNFDDKFVARWRLDGNRSSGEGKITSSDPEDFTTPYTENSTFSLSPISNVPGPAGFMLPAVMMTRSLYDLGQKSWPKEYRFPQQCMRRAIEESYEIELPTTVRVTSIPRDVSYDDGALRYRASYILKGNSLSVQRKFEADRLNPVCSTSDEEGWRRFHKVLRRDLISQIIYQ